MEKRMQNDMSGKELKEMIDANAFALDELDNAALEKLLDYETDMLCLGLGDMMTIRRCSELLNERNSSEALTEEKVFSVIEKTKNECVVIVDDTKPVRPKRIVLRRVGLVAAVLASVLTLGALIPTAFGVDIYDRLRDIVRQEDGTKIDVGNQTIHNVGSGRKYSSVEEMEKAEGVDIMSPSKLPENVTIKSIDVHMSVIGDLSIGISTNDINVLISVDTNTKGEDVWAKDGTNYEKNGVKYRIDSVDGKYIATAYHNGDEYYISAKSYDDLILIIDSMEK